MTVPDVPQRLKDPDDDQPRAFELLGLTGMPSASEVQRAYALQTGKTTDRSARVQLTEAWRRLRTAEGRLEETIWYYPLGALPDLAALGDEGLFLEALRPPHVPFDLSGLCIDLLDAANPDACPVLDCPEVNLEELPAYRPTLPSYHPLHEEIDR